jgi:hypothetical protein
MWRGRKRILIAIWSHGVSIIRNYYRLFLIARALLRLTGGANVCPESQGVQEKGRTPMTISELRHADGDANFTA